MLKPHSKFEGSILKHFKVIPISIPTSPQWFYSLTQAMTSEAENSGLNGQGDNYVELFQNL